MLTVSDSNIYLDFSLNFFSLIIRDVFLLLSGKDQEEKYTSRLQEMLPRRALVSKYSPNVSSTTESAPEPAPAPTVPLLLLDSKNSTNFVDTKDHSVVAE